MFSHRKEASTSSAVAPPPAPQITDIPLDVFYRLCVHLKNNFLDTEGLFRMSGAVDDVRSMREALAKDPKTPFTASSSGNTPRQAHLYASVLTSFLREQSQSLFPFGMYDALCNAQAIYNGKGSTPAKPEGEEKKEQTEEKKDQGDAVDIPPPPMTPEESQKYGLELFHDCIEKVPKHNKLLLHCLLDLLDGVNKHSEKNKMNANNLGVVFGPTLIKKENEDLMSIMTMTDRCDVIATIIRNFEKLFPNPVNPSDYTPSEGQSGVSLLRHSTRHSMSRNARSASFSSSKVHDKWFESFPGFQSARTLLAQAEQAVETQMAAEAETQKRLQRQTVDPHTLAVAMKLSGSSGAPQSSLQRELEEAREEAHRSSLALSQIIIKLVEIIREKAALEDENARLYARLETELSRKGYFGNSSGDEDKEAANAGPVKNRMVADVVKRVNSLKSDDFAFEPHDVLKKLDVLQGRMVAGCCEALPTSLEKTLLAVSNTIKRSADVVQSLQTSANSGADFCKQLLDESSQQLQQIAKDVTLTRTRMSAVAEREIGATAHSIMAYACGEEKPNTFVVPQEAPVPEQKKPPPPQSDLTKAMAVLGIKITRVGSDEEKKKDDDNSESEETEDNDEDEDGDGSSDDEKKDEGEETK